MKNSPSIYKKFSQRTRKYYYYSRSTGKRISKKSYYTRLKISHSRRKSLIQKKPQRSTTKKAKRSSPKKRVVRKLTRENVKGKYSKGFNVSARVRWDLEAQGVEGVYDLTENFYQDILKARYKLDDKNISGISWKGYLKEGRFDRVEFTRHTRSVFHGEFKELQVRGRVVTDALNQIYRMLIKDEVFSFEEEARVSDDTYDQIIITKISLRQRLSEVSYAKDKPKKRGRVSTVSRKRARRGKK